MICSGMGGKGNALKACDVGDVGDVVGDDAADDDGDSIVMIVFDLLFLEMADEQGFADTNLVYDVRRVTM
jgi:hypothetical protein